MSDPPRSRAFLWVLLGGGAFFLFLLAVFALVYFTVRSEQKTSSFSSFGDKIAVVDLEGVIISPKTSWNSCASMVMTARSRPSLFM